MESRLFLSAGQLDPFFGTGGVVTTTFASSTSQATDLATMPNGQILALGVHSDAGSSRLVLARYGVNGQPDATFGSGGAAPAGVVVTDISGESGKLELLPNGKFLVVSGTRLARFNADGSVDPTFTQDGHTSYKFPFVVHDIDVQEDGKILLSGRYRQTAVKPGISRWRG